MDSLATAPGSQLTLKPKAGDQGLFTTSSMRFFDQQRPECVASRNMRVLLIAALLAALSLPAHSECLPSAEAVWNTHPGSHATWRLRLPGHEGEKCWFARGPTTLPAPRIRQEREADQRTDGQTKRPTSRALAADRPDESPAGSQSQEIVPPDKRGPSSILIWGTPMRIDPTWEEFFDRRERGAE